LVHAGNLSEGEPRDGQYNYGPFIVIVAMEITEGKATRSRSDQLAAEVQSAG
jgi:hypothetical protein